MAIQVLHKVERRGATKPPCCTDDYYSIDNGNTWMSRKEFYQWHDSLIEIVPPWKRKG